MYSSAKGDQDFPSSNKNLLAGSSGFFSQGEGRWVEICGDEAFEILICGFARQTILNILESLYSTVPVADNAKNIGSTRPN